MRRAARASPRHSGSEGPFAPRQGLVLPAPLDGSWKLVAARTHELAHLRLPAFPTKPPDGRQEVGRTTDLAAAMIGAACLAGIARSISSDFRTRFRNVGNARAWVACSGLLGPRYLGSGNLEGREWVFALSVLFELAGRDAGAVRVTLKLHRFGDLRTAIKSLCRRPALLAGIEGN